MSDGRDEPMCRHREKTAADIGEQSVERREV